MPFTLKGEMPIGKIVIINVDKSGSVLYNKTKEGQQVLSLPIWLK